MHRASWSGRPALAGHPPPLDRYGLLTSASELSLAERRAERRRPLTGRRLGLICPDAASEDARLFRRAAQELGAHVAQLLMPPDPPIEPHQLMGMARMLSALYDGVECQGVSRELIDRLSISCTVPVYEGLGSAEHGIAELARCWASPAPLAERRRWLVQAALLASLR